MKIPFAAFYVCNKRGNNNQVCNLLHNLTVIYLSTNVYASLSFCECLQCLSNLEVQTWQMAPCQNRWDCAVLVKLVSL